MLSALDLNWASYWSKHIRTNWFLLWPHSHIGFFCGLSLLCAKVLLRLVWCWPSLDSDMVTSLWHWLSGDNTWCSGSVHRICDMCLNIINQSQKAWKINLNHHKLHEAIACKLLSPLVMGCPLKLLFKVTFNDNVMSINLPAAATAPAEACNWCNQLHVHRKSISHITSFSKWHYLK